MELLERTAVLAELTERRVQCQNALGKTAIQKLIYLLQEVYGVKLGYYFELYTYGPYDSDVMQDIDYAAATGILEVNYNQDRGYDITLGPQSSSLDAYRETIVSAWGDQLDQLFEHFGSLSAKDLELRATLVFVFNDEPNRTREEVIQLTRDLKPKFSPEEMEAAYDHLETCGVWELCK